MKKILFLFMLAGMLPGQIFGQKTIAVLKFLNKTDMAPETKELLEDAFVQAAKSQVRFTVLEREQLQNIEAERERQKSEELMDSQIAEQGKALGADYLLLGEVQDWSQTDWKYQASGNYPAGRSVKLDLTLAVRVISTETGEIVYTHQQNLFERKEISSQSPQFNEPTYKVMPGILQAFAGRCRNYANGLLYQVFQPDIQILELSELSGKKVKTVTIGSTAVLHDNVTLEVYREETLEVEGEKATRKIPVGVLAVNRMEGEKIANCRVLEGGKEILSLFNENVKLQCAVKGGGATRF